MIGNMLSPPLKPTNAQRVLQDLRLQLKRKVERWRIASWNVGLMNGRGRELAGIMKRRGIDIMCVQETKWKGNVTRELGDDCKITHSGEGAKRNGVEVIVRGEWK